VTTHNEQPTDEDPDSLARHPVIGSVNVAVGADRAAQLLVRWHHNGGMVTVTDALRREEILRRRGSGRRLFMPRSRARPFVQR
jgi:diketogulonate reductase-like aldo/keto reductase